MAEQPVAQPSFLDQIKQVPSALLDMIHSRYAPSTPTAGAQLTGGLGSVLSNRADQLQRAMPAIPASPVNAPQAPVNLPQPTGFYGSRPGEQRLDAEGNVLSGFSGTGQPLR